MIVAPGTQSLSLLVQIVDDSGLGVASLVAATFPAVYIERAGETAVAVTLSDLAAENSAWASGGVHESASGGGYYRIDAPNALAATANQCAKLVGEASGKHLICPVVQVEKPAVTLAPADVSGNLPANAVQIGGAAPGSAVIGTVTNVTNAPTAGDFTTTMKTSLNAATPAVTVSDKTGFKLASDGVDAITVESGLNLRQAASVTVSAAAGVLAGAAGTTVTIAAAGVPTTNRITATVDSDGNRSEVTLNPPA